MRFSGGGGGGGTWQETTGNCRRVSGLSVPQKSQSQKNRCVFSFSVEIAANGQKIAKEIAAIFGMRGKNRSVSVFSKSQRFRDTKFQGSRIENAGQLSQEKGDVGKGTGAKKRDDYSPHGMGKKHKLPLMSFTSLVFSNQINYLVFWVFPAVFFIPCLGGRFGPEKEYLAPPSKFPGDSLPTPRPPPPPSRGRTPPAPPGIFNKKKNRPDGFNRILTGF